MSHPRSILSIARLAPFVALLLFGLGHCGGDSTSGADASTGGAGDGSGGVGSDGAGGDAGSGSGGGGADGGGGVVDAGPDTGGRPVCTGPNMPLGCYCVTDATCGASQHCLSGSCVQCRASADCGNAQPVCWPGDHTCHAACGEGGATCPMGIGQPNRCDTSTGACVGCLGSTDCNSMAAPVCDTSAMRCVQCLTDMNCAGAMPHCDPTTFTCVACVTNADCAGSAGGPVCRTGFNRVGQMTRACQPGCTSSAQCVDAGANAKVCDSTSSCVECIDNATCSGTAPVCDAVATPFGPPSPTFHRCVVCLPGGDAGTQGCDGGPGTCYFNMMRGGYVCR
jgi:hypothetical protein